MRVIPEELQARLDAGATTLAWCWRITRADGQVLGFTDHDRDLSFDGVLHRAGSADAAGTLEQEAGFSSDTSAVAGVLDSAAVTEADIAAGLYDDAEAALYRVDWTDPSLRVLIWRGRLGEVRRGETGFEVELRGLSSALERTIGRVLQRRCDAELGDARCGVDLELSVYRGTGIVSALTDGRRFVATGLESFASDWFARGKVAWLTGANAGAVSLIEAHRAVGSVAAFELLAAPGGAMSVGDQFTAIAGCDKRWRSCRDKFANVANFRGFPMTPGDDWVLSSAQAGQTNDGGSLWTDREG